MDHNRPRTRPVVAAASCPGVIVLRASAGGSGGNWEYLLLRAFNYWDFPKGMREPGEHLAQHGAARGARKPRSTRSISAGARCSARHRRTTTAARSRYYLAVAPADATVDLPVGPSQPARAQRIPLGDAARGLEPADAARARDPALVRHHPEPPAAPGRAPRRCRRPPTEIHIKPALRRGSGRFTVPAPRLCLWPASPRTKPRQFKTTAPEARHHADSQVPPAEIPPPRHRGHLFPPAPASARSHHAGTARRPTR